MLTQSIKSRLQRGFTISWPCADYCVGTHYYCVGTWALLLRGWARIIIAWARIIIAWERINHFNLFYS